MLIPDKAYDLLVESGLAVSAELRGEGPTQVDLMVTAPANLVPALLRPPSGDLTLDLEVIRSSRPVRPSAIRALVERAMAHQTGRIGVLLICPAATPLLRRQAARAGVSLIALNHGSSSGADGHLVLAPGHVLPLGGAGTEPAPAVPRPRSWARWQVLRAVALVPDVTQRDLVAATGVSQARVSQLLGAAVRSGLLERETAHRLPGQGAGEEADRPAAPAADPGPEPAARHWLVADWPRLLHHWRDSYPGHGGIATHWFGLDPLPDQVDATLDVLPATNHDRARLARVSGDVAADVLAPWGRPRRAVVYTARGADLAAAGLTPCSAAEATLTLVVPQDPGVLQANGRTPLIPESGSARWPLADPLQILLDLAASPSVDADQMADHFERWLLARLAPDARPTSEAGSTPRRRLSGDER